MTAHTPIRSLHVFDSFSPLSESFAYDTLRGLDRVGVDSHVVTAERVNEATRPHPSVTVVARRPVTRPGMWPVLPVLAWRHRRVVGLTRRVWADAVGDATAGLRPDVVHAHFGPAGVAAMPIARRHRAPLVVTFYGYDVSSLARSRRWRMAYRELWDAAASVVVLSEQMREEVVALGCPVERMRVVHLARDLDAFAYRAPRRPVRRFVSVGRLVEKKGHVDAIDAFARVGDRAPDATLTIVGDGPLRDALGARVTERGLDGRVRVVDGIAAERVAEVMSDADAFVLCSRTAADGDREGTPTVLIEAQAVGLPCVATRHAGIPEMFEAGASRALAGEGDVQAIASRMGALIDASVASLADEAERGRAYVERHFTLAGQAVALRAIYDGVIAAG